MDKKLDQYQISTSDWRTALRRNQRRTFNVIILFILLYVALGFIVDLYLFSNDTIPIEDTAKELVTFKIVPLATIIMIVVAVGSVLITILFNNRLMMLGTEYHEVLPDSKSFDEKQLYNIVEELKIAAAMRFMPRVFIIEADYMNAFASGMSEKSAMVAITKGLLQKLDRDEIQAVMAHELSHIRHDDTRLTVSVSILSNLILIVLDIIFRIVLLSSKRDRNNALAAVLLILRFLLPIITVLLVLYLSRKRELMADSGSVELTRSNEPLARALIKIDTDTKQNSEEYSQEYNKTPHEEVRKASYLYDPKYAGLSVLESVNGLFSTHPPLEERLKALGITPKK